MHQPARVNLHNVAVAQQRRVLQTSAYNLYPLIRMARKIHVPRIVPLVQRRSSLNFKFNQQTDQAQTSNTETEKYTDDTFPDSFYIMDEYDLSNYSSEEFWTRVTFNYTGPYFVGYTLTPWPRTNTSTPSTTLSDPVFMRKVRNFFTQETIEPRHEEFYKWLYKSLNHELPNSKKHYLEYAAALKINLTEGAKTTPFEIPLGFENYYIILKNIDAAVERDLKYKNSSDFTPTVCQNARYRRFRKWFMTNVVGYDTFTVDSSDFEGYDYMQNPVTYRTRYSYTERTDGSTTPLPPVT